MQPFAKCGAPLQWLPSIGARRVLRLLLVAALAASGLRAQLVPAVTIQSRLTPKSVYSGAPSQLVITVKGPSLAGLTLRFRATKGFHVAPVEQAWASGEVNNTLVCLADVTNSDAPMGIATGAIMTTALIKDGGALKQVGANILDFEFQRAMLPLSYLTLGTLGIAIGYVLRLFILALNSAKPAPQTLALAQEAPEGLRKFVLQHYYWVDFAVTLAVGFLALTALMKDGRPPANAVYWHNALLIGIGLGLLTNSDLLTRVQVR